MVIWWTHRIPECPRAWHSIPHPCKMTTQTSVTGSGSGPGNWSSMLEVWSALWPWSIRTHFQALHSHRKAKNHLQARGTKGSQNMQCNSVLGCTTVQESLLLTPGPNSPGPVLVLLWVWVSHSHGDSSFSVEFYVCIVERKWDRMSSSVGMTEMHWPFSKCVLGHCYHSH